MKEDLYHITLNDNENSIVIRCLNDKKTELMENGKFTDAIDELLIKFCTAPRKKFKVISRSERDDAR